MQQVCVAFEVRRVPNSISICLRPLIMRRVNPVALIAPSMSITTFGNGSAFI
jgi:hypothetical protein